MVRLSFTTCAMSLTSLLVIGEDVMSLFSQNMQHHSLSVGHKNRCNETAFHKMCNVTHKLLTIGKDVMGLLFTKCAMSLTSCQS